jgi:hypothetical protein
LEAHWKIIEVVRSESENNTLTGKGKQKSKADKARDSVRHTPLQAENEELEDPVSSDPFASDLDETEQTTGTRLPAGIWSKRRPGTHKTPARRFNGKISLLSVTATNGYVTTKKGVATSCQKRVHTIGFPFSGRKNGQSRLTPKCVE